KSSKAAKSGMCCTGNTTWTNYAGWALLLHPTSEGLDPPRVSCKKSESEGRPGSAALIFLSDFSPRRFAEPPQYFSSAASARCCLRTDQKLLRVGTAL